MEILLNSLPNGTLNKIIIFPCVIIALLYYDCGYYSIHVGLFNMRKPRGYITTLDQF